MTRDAWRGQERSLELRMMLAAIRHRGPDGDGIWEDTEGHGSLAQCRLAIVDLSPQGAQPMIADRECKVLALNGEVYNYVELRQQLESEGATFRGHSDTEVLLNAICIWGIEETLRRVVGMFAFAVWDGANRSLHLVRDRVGKKPLYYYTGPGRFYFASEIKALSSIQHLGLSDNYQALFHYLSFGYIPAPSTIYSNVLELMPGNRLDVSIADLRARISRYWILPRPASRRIGVAEAADEAEHYLSDAIRLRLRADVPVGIFLSGGLDSGLITAIAAKHSSRPVQTFTVAFDSKHFDESRLASEVSERFRTEHHELRFPSDLSGLLNQVANVYDEPFADPSVLPTLAIAQEASRHLKVVLNGEGGDELFAGYRRHIAAKRLAHLTGVSGAAVMKALRLASRTVPCPRSFRTGYSFFYRFLKGASCSPFARYVAWTSDGFTDDEKRALLRDGGAGLQSTESYLAERFYELRGLDALTQFMLLDFQAGMADCLLMKLDMATMAYGLEARCPFLDHRLVEWAWTLDRADILAGRDTKPVLRELAHRHLPPSIPSAPKRGFDLPLMEWLRGSLATTAREVCLSQHGILADLCDREWLSGLFGRKRPLDDERWSKLIWVLFMLALWDRGRRGRAL